MSHLAREAGGISLARIARKATQASLHCRRSQGQTRTATRTRGLGASRSRARSPASWAELKPQPLSASSSSFSAKWMQYSPSSRPRALSGGQHAPSRSAQRISSSARPPPALSQCFVHLSSATCKSPRPSSTVAQGSTPCPSRRASVGIPNTPPSALQPASANQAFLRYHRRLHGPNWAGPPPCHLRGM